jgi:hypothetical protein
VPAKPTWSPYASLDLQMWPVRRAGLGQRNVPIRTALAPSRPPNTGDKLQGSDAMLTTTGPCQLHPLVRWRHPALHEASSRQRRGRARPVNANPGNTASSDPDRRVPQDPLPEPGALARPKLDRSCLAFASARKDGLLARSSAAEPLRKRPRDACQADLGRRTPAWICRCDRSAVPASSTATFLSGALPLHRVQRTLELSCEAPLCSASSASTPC